LGLRRLRAYRKEWDESRGVWKDRPRHDDASHGADAFLTFAYSNYAPPSALLDCAVGAQVAGDVELHRGFGDVDCRPF
jgi:hypothetical protein